MPVTSKLTPAQLAKIAADERPYKCIAGEYKISVSYIAKLKHKAGTGRCQKKLISLKSLSSSQP